MTPSDIVIGINAISKFVSFLTTTSFFRNVVLSMILLLTEKHAQDGFKQWKCFDSSLAQRALASGVCKAISGSGMDMMHRTPYTH